MKYKMYINYFSYSSRDKRDIDIIRENHRFLWDESDDNIDTWYEKTN